MKKKILVISIMAVFMLVAISFASTVSSNTSKPIRKESPLFGIRTRRAIREKIGNLLTWFIGERVFFLPFQWMRNRNNLPLRYHLGKNTALFNPCYTFKYDTEGCYTCAPYC